MLPDGTNCFWFRKDGTCCTVPSTGKLFRKRATGVIMEHRYDRIGHIEHCEHLLLDSGGLVDVVTEAAVGLGGDRLELGPNGGCPSDRAAAQEHQDEGSVAHVISPVKQLLVFFHRSSQLLWFSGP
jgi:hypothetical protein